MSCLFDSLSCFTPFKSYDLRQHICDYMATDPQIIDGMKMSEAISWNFDGVKLPRYVQYMRQHHTWGGANEIKCFCDLFGCKVVVHILSGARGPNGAPRTIETLPARRRTDKVVHITWTECHYEPLKLTRDG